MSVIKCSNNSALTIVSQKIWHLSTTWLTSMRIKPIAIIVINRIIWKCSMTKITRKTWGLNSVDHQETNKVIWPKRTNQSLTHNKQNSLKIWIEKTVSGTIKTRLLLTANIFTSMGISRSTEIHPTSFRTSKARTTREQRIWWQVGSLRAASTSIDL